MILLPTFWSIQIHWALLWFSWASLSGALSFSAQYGRFMGCTRRSRLGAVLVCAKLVPPCGPLLSFLQDCSVPDQLFLQESHQLVTWLLPLSAADQLPHHLIAGWCMKETRAKTQEKTSSIFPFSSHYHQMLHRITGVVRNVCISADEQLTPFAVILVQEFIRTTSAAGFPFVHTDFQFRVEAKTKL